LAKIQGIITNSPAAAKSPEIVNRLTKVTREIKNVDNKVIRDNLGVNEVIFEEIIKKDPERWEALKNRIMAATETPSEAAGQAPASITAPQVKAQGISPNEEIRVAKDGRKIVYDKNTKQPIRVYGE